MMHGATQVRPGQLLPVSVTGTPEIGRKAPHGLRKTSIRDGVALLGDEEVPDAVGFDCSGTHILHNDVSFSMSSMSSSSSGSDSTLVGSER